VPPGAPPPYKQYAVKALSKQRLRRMKKSVVAGADGRMVVKTGEDMVCVCVRVRVLYFHSFFNWGGGMGVGYRRRHCL
jgi:hypothetical protein